MIIPILMNVNLVLLKSAVNVLMEVHVNNKLNKLFYNLINFFYNLKVTHVLEVRDRILQELLTLFVNVHLTISMMILAITQLNVRHARVLNVLPVLII